jgi:hypothetical protein
MRQLFKIDFVRDTFLPYIESNIRDRSYLSSILLAYRFAKYAQLNKYGDDIDYLNRPQIAVKIFLDEFVDKRFTNIELDIIALLLTMVMTSSYLLTIDDVEHIFGSIVKNKVKLLLILYKIANSRAKITKVKQRKYKEDFPRRIIAVKAAIISTELRLITLTKAKKFPVKVFNRYLPIFDVYPDIGSKISTDLKKWLLQKIKEAQSSSEYNITKGDIFSYFSIMNDDRFK